MGFTLPYGLHGGAVGDISINVGGLISGQAGVRALSVGGHGNWGFPAGNGAAGGNVLFGTGSAGLTVNTLAVDSPAVDAASVGGAGGMGLNSNPGGDGGHGGRGGNFIFEGQTVLNLETFGPESGGFCEVEIDGHAACCGFDLIEAGLSEAAFTQPYGDFVLAARFGLMSGSLKHNDDLPQHVCGWSIAGILSSTDSRGAV